MSSVPTPSATMPAMSITVKAMPAVFVLIWSTGFIVAKFGLPYAPPLSFLAIRYALSIACFLIWIVLTRAAWPQGRPRCAGVSRRPERSAPARLFARVDPKRCLGDDLVRQHRVRGVEPAAAHVPVQPL